MKKQPSLVYLYGFSTMLETKLNTVKQIIEHQLNKCAQISFVFIQDGVIGTSCKIIISSSMKGLLELPISFYTLIPDLEARGIDINELQNNVKAIGYEDLVDILAITSKIVSWM